MQTANTNTMFFLLHGKNLNLGVLEPSLVLEELKPQFLVEVNRKVNHI